MNKISPKLWAYGIIFIIRALIFNIALGFAITSLVFVKDGLTIWAIVSISLASLWISVNITNHIIWSKMTHNERALYFGIRRHGHNVVQVTEKEIKRRTGQQDVLEILRDTDSSLEIQMLVNGTGIFINLFVGIKWIGLAKKFNNNSDVFKFEIIKK